jgi:hypothetical protein
MKRFVLFVLLISDEVVVMEKNSIFHVEIIFFKFFWDGGGNGITQFISHLGFQNTKMLVLCILNVHTRCLPFKILFFRRWLFTNPLKFLIIISPFLISIFAIVYQYANIERDVPIKEDFVQFATLPRALHSLIQ